MKSFIFCILMFCSFAWAQAPRTNIQFGDDTWVQVPLQFPFPLYGSTFTNSFMFSNGVVGFFGINQNPVTSFCCSGENLSSNSWTGFNYSIMPLWTDLYPVNASSFYVEGDSTYQKYQWNNIAEISNMNNLNTFGVTIQPSGLINFNYDNINLQNQYVTSAVTGNLASGEFMQFYYGIGMNNTTLTSLNFSVTPQYNDPCVSNPLSSSSCPGYQIAYHDQQCSINTLYATTCSGYQQAYLDQQCSANSLYDTSCPGYDTAYFNQQCSLDGLYDRQCSNYAEAYAKQNLLNQTVSVTTEATVSTTEPSIQVGDDGKVTTEVSLVSDPVVNTIVTKKTETKKEESKDETKPVAENKTESKPQAKREPPKVDPATQTASEKEFEKEIAIQNQAIAAISLVPGFSSYQNSIVPDLMGVQMQRQYNKPNIDNVRLMRQMNGASDRLHNDMIQQQYR